MHKSHLELQHPHAFLDSNRQAGRKISIVIIINALVMVAEIVAGIIFGLFFVFFIVGIVLYIVGRDVKRAEVSEVITKMRERDESRAKTEKEIEEAYYAEDDEVVEPEEEDDVVEKEIDMKSISDEIKKKPPKTRSRSERRRRN